jgi:ketosteroid isomerase-like protein
MSALWERSDRATCTHPGWPTLRGWGPIAASFFALFQGPQDLQFVLTEERVQVHGDAGWATVDENLLGAQGGATVAAVNLFVREGSGGWRLVCHHGSVINTAIGMEPGAPSGQEDP